MSWIAEDLARFQQGKHGWFEESGQAFGLELELTEGMRFKSKTSPTLATDTERQESIWRTRTSCCTLRDQHAALLEKVMQANKPLLIITKDVEGGAWPL